MPLLRGRDDGVTIDTIGPQKISVTNGIHAVNDPMEIKHTGSEHAGVSLPREGIPD